jgi:hypothetical protein
VVPFVRGEGTKEKTMPALLDEPRAKTATVNETKTGFRFEASTKLVAAVIFFLVVMPGAMVLRDTIGSGDTRTFLIMIPHTIVTGAIVACWLTAGICFGEE